MDHELGFHHGEDYYGSASSGLESDDSSSSNGSTSSGDSYRDPAILTHLDEQADSLEPKMFPDALASKYRPMALTGHHY